MNGYLSHILAVKCWLVCLRVGVFIFCLFLGRKDHVWGETRCAPSFPFHSILIFLKLFVEDEYSQHRGVRFPLSYSRNSEVCTSHSFFKIWFKYFTWKTKVLAIWHVPITHLFEEQWGVRLPFPFSTDFIEKRFWSTWLILEKSLVLTKGLLVFYFKLKMIWTRLYGTKKAWIMK